jgi:hypothetical protein
LQKKKPRKRTHIPNDPAYGTCSGADPKVDFAVGFASELDDRQCQFLPDGFYPKRAAMPERVWMAVKPGI